LIFVPRPESINAVEDQRQDYSERDHAHDRVCDAAMMMQERPTIAKGEDDDI
jgi:hypothetical protein